MKRRKILLLFILTFSLFLLTGCFKSSAVETVTTEDKSTSGDNMNDYWFYKNTKVKVNEKEGKNIYYASDGYTLTRIQGHNGFYYEYKDSDGTYKDLVLNDGEFRYEDIYIADDLMKSSEDLSTVRMFKSKYSGKALIKNSVFVKEGDTATIELYKNDQLLLTKIVDNESLYFETEESLLSGDEIRFVVKGNVAVSYNPCIDYLMEEETLLHTACDGYYGDVHPYYSEEENRLYMFYLSTGMQKTSKVQQYQTMLTVSDDMLHYTDALCEMNEKNRPEQDLYFVLNVFKDKEGNYRSSQGGNLKTCSSVSTDLHTWSGGSTPYMNEDGILSWRYSAAFSNDAVSGRDPDTYYDSETDKYYTVVLNYYSTLGDKGEKYLTLYVANSKGEYSNKGIKLINFTARGDSECPQVKKIDGRWYLFYSVYGTGNNGNVGKPAYRVSEKNADIETVDWNSLPEHYLDGGDLHAAQVFSIKDKYYIYGWIQYQFNSNVWGGYLNLPHEVYVKSDGTLGVKFDSELLKLLNKGLISSLDSVNKETKLGNVYRNIISLDAYDTESEISIGSYKIKFMESGGSLYLSLSNGVYSNIQEVERSDKYSFTIIMDGNFMEINVNGEAMMTCFTDISIPQSLEVKPGNSSFKNIKISKLADLNNVYK